MIDCTDWHWFVWIRPFLIRTASVLFAFVSLAIIWSETVFKVEKMTLSIPALILKDPNIGYVALEVIIAKINSFSLHPSFSSCTCSIALPIPYSKSNISIT
jgi:hypothetical protein